MATIVDFKAKNHIRIGVALDAITGICETNNPERTFVATDGHGNDSTVGFYVEETYDEVKRKVEEAE